MQARGDVHARGELGRKQHAAIRAVCRQIARSGDREAARSLDLIIALSDSCRGRSDLTEEDEEKLRGLAAELIPEFVDNLYAWRKSRPDGARDTEPAA